MRTCTKHLNRFRRSHERGWNVGERRCVGHGRLVEQWRLFG
jgi:hypothetical protein